MHYVTEIQRENAIASLAKWEDFLAAIRDMKPRERYEIMWTGEPVEELKPMEIV